MAILIRRGDYNYFDIAKMLPGEFALVTTNDPNSEDGTAVYICVKTGSAKRLATYEDMLENIDQAAKGERGSRWYTGTAISGTSLTPTSYNTGINDALKDDYYLNTEKGRVYVCTEGGSYAVAKWKYVTSIMGPSGTGGGNDFNENTAVEFEPTLLNRQNVKSGDSLVDLFKKVYIYFAGLRNVAFSGEYDDLTGRPNLKTVATSGKYDDLTGKPNLKTVATSGSYNDLTDKPTISDLQGDSGWKSIKTSGSYQGVAAHMPQCRKIGNIVEVSGAIRNTANQIAGSTSEVTLGTLPSTAYYPSKMVVSSGTTSLENICQVRVNTNGTITASRASEPGSAGYTSIPANTAIFFHVMYFV